MKYTWDDFELDTDAFRLDRAGAPLALEPKALDLLVLLVERAGKLVTKQEILDAVWSQTAVTDYALTRVIAQLRKALGDEAREARFIETVPTRGYRWIRPVSAHQTAQRPLLHAETTTVERATVVPSRKLRPAHLVATLAAIAILITGYAVYGLRRDGVSTAWSDPRVTHPIAFPEQLTTGIGIDLQPAISPQGDAVAFASDRTGSLELYIRSLSGTAIETPLTRDGGQNTQPAWSPDGTQIAYHSYREGGVWVIPSRGGVPRQIVAQGSHPAWSPDGRQLAYQTDEFTDISPGAFAAQIGSTLQIVNVDGSGRRALTTEGTPPGGHGAPVWSRDGRRIAFVSFEDVFNKGVWSVATLSGEVRQLGAGPGLYELAFTPDNAAVLAAGGEAMLFRMPIDPDTGAPAGPRDIIPLPGVSGVRGLSVSADGKRAVFASLWLDSHIWAQPLTRDGKPDGAPRALTRDRTLRNSLPMISPDGSRVAYMSTRQGQAPNIWVMGIDGRDPIQVTSDETADGQPNWFPDGRRIAYTSNRNQQLGIWSVDIETRRDELMVDAESLQRIPSVHGRLWRLAEVRLSPTLRRAAFALIVQPENRRVLYSAELSPFSARRLTDGSTSVGYPAWSPDERSIAVEIKSGSSTQAGVVDTGSGRLRILTDARGQTWVRSWSPDSRRIVAALLRGGRWSLQTIDAATSELSSIVPDVPVNTYVRYPDWSPRGDVVVYERGEVTGNIWSVRLGQ